MNAEHLLTHFDRIADAPGAIPRLRRFILDLAVRGKLVEQNPEDAPPPPQVLREVAQDLRERPVRDPLLEPPMARLVGGKPGGEVFPPGT